MFGHKSSIVESSSQHSFLTPEEQIATEDIDKATPLCASSPHRSDVQTLRCQPINEKSKSRWDLCIDRLQKRFWRSSSIILLSFCIILLYKMLLPEATELQDVESTDGKSYPAGLIAWSQRLAALPCGTTPTEALARGCHFDMIATAWLPLKCIDEELVSEFEALYPWEYFSNQNGTGKLPREADLLGSQKGLVWTTHRWHSAHCLFMWKKLNRALLHGWSTDGESLQQRHTDHCTLAILQDEDLDAITSVVEIVYPSC